MMYPTARYNIELIMTVISTKKETIKRPQKFKGVVVKISGKDTIVVSVSRYVKHPKYKKYQTRIKKYLVHAPENTVQVGDSVIIVASRPISKMKHFMLHTTAI